MASSLRTKLRIARTVLGASGFFDAIAGRFLWQPDTPSEVSASSPAAGDWVDLAGAVHVHTSTYSDGAGDVPTVMAAAAQAGVDFVLLTDHNTLRPRRDGWEERFEKPLLLVGTEITVDGGAFLLALDLPADWEPTKHLSAQATIDQVRAQGGFPLVSLPDDMKHPWEDWDATGYEGLEALNLSTVARAHINVLSLLWLLPLWRLRGEAAVLRAICARPDEPLRRWDTLLSTGRRQVGIGALDAHALMKIGKRKYPIPSYARSFQAATTHTLLPRDALSSPAATRREILAALRAGRCYFAYDCLGDPREASFRFVADSGATLGQEVPCGASLTARCDRVGAKEAPLLRLFYGGRIVAAGWGSLSWRADLPGAYRLEVSQVGHRVGALVGGARPWIFTNPIYAVTPTSAGTLPGASSS